MRCEGVDVPTLAVENHLDKALATFGELNADVARRIAETAGVAAERVESLEAGRPCLVVGGRPLCSRREPMEEASRLADPVDVVEHAVVVVLGFGAGYHVQRLAERMGKAGLIVVFEPDVSLLRTALEQIDHSEWLKRSLVLWVTDAEDRAGLARKLQNAESILAQGVHVLAHPASRDRLGERAARFTEHFSQHISAAKTTLMTTLVRSVDTVANLILNVDHYAAGSGLAELEGMAKGSLGVVVSAGPSLQRNMHLLAEPGVRERCVIVSTQTTLKPLLKAGIRPHFVTALDYHEISKRFYEGIREEDVKETTLIADPKAHPVILDSYPGPIRCCANGFLDKVLGGLSRPMGTVKPGATVAHLAMYVARFLGCDPVAMIGQDLGFTDGVYYSRGTAIDEVWSPELNPFNTIEMMEWQRIARHRLHLVKTTDVFGKTIYTDAQMRTYLQQFERDFSEDVQRGLTVIDATEGGVAKQHTTPMTLGEALERYATRPLPAMALPSRRLDAVRLERCRRRLEQVDGEIRAVGEAARKSQEILDRMLERQERPTEMDRLFAQLDRERKVVEQRSVAFDLLNHVNQMGVFRRFKADRRLHFAEDLPELEQQRRQLERDRENVTWIGEAATEFSRQIAQADRVLQGLPAEVRATAGAAIEGSADATHAKAHVEGSSCVRAAAVVPIDLSYNGRGQPRDLTAELGGKSVLQRTLERLGRSKRLERIVLLAPERFHVDAMVDRSAIGLPVEVHVCGQSPYGPEQQAVAAARAFADTSWRGGIAGMSIYDEVLCPKPTLEAMEALGITAAVLAAPDWPLVDVSEEAGVDALVRRHSEHPEQLNIVFTQAPPGFGACLVSASLLRECVARNRLCTIGALLVYQPHAPQHDPIARDVNVQIDHAVRRSLIRGTFDSPRYRLRIRRAIEPLFMDSPGGEVSTAQAIAAIEHQWLQLPTFSPTHVILELCTGRSGCGAFNPHRHDVVQRTPMTVKLAEKILSQLGESRDTVLTLAGLGDPLRHPEFDRIIRLAKSSGIRAVHVRTELVAEKPILDRLLGSGVDVVSVDLHADTAATYKRMMGMDRFGTVVANIAYLVEHRRRLTDHPGHVAFALPWIVPRLQRRPESFDDIDTFFDRWQHALGTCLIEGPPPWEATEFDEPEVTLASTQAPARHMIREGLRRMVIFSDGGVPVSELDVHGESLVGNAAETPILELWRDLFSRRREIRRESGDSAEALRTFGP